MHCYLQNLLYIFLYVLWFCLACFWTPNDVPFFLHNISLPTVVVKMGYRVLPPIVFIVAMYYMAPKIKIGKSWVWQILMELGRISLGIYVVQWLSKTYLRNACYLYFLMFISSFMRLYCFLG